VLLVLDLLNGEFLVLLLFVFGDYFEELVPSLVVPNKSLFGINVDRRLFDGSNIIWIILLLILITPHFVVKNLVSNCVEVFVDDLVAVLDYVRVVLIEYREFV
jgi:hypothetical protein